MTLTVNGNTFTGTVSGGLFSINVPGTDLTADSDSTIDASVTTSDAAGNTATATDTEGYSVDTSASATITVDNITADDIVNAAEAGSTIAVTGTVGGDAAPGDTVSFTINGTDYSGTVAGDLTYSIDVAGSDLAADTSFDATVTGTDDAGNPFSATTTSTHTTDFSPPDVSNVPDTNYTENDAQISLLDGVTISDADNSSLSSVVVTIDGYISSEDDISYLTAGTSVVGSVSTSGTTWTLTLTGGTDINEYETVLDTLSYQNSSDNPSSSNRDITVTAYDEDYATIFDSDAGTLTITPVNDAPEAFDNMVYTLESSTDNALGITPPTDPDTADSTLVITVTGLPGALGTVTLADGTPVTVGQTLTLAELTALEFDAGGAEGSGTFTYDVGGGFWQLV